MGLARHKTESDRKISTEISPAQTAEIAARAQNLHALWAAPTTSTADRKEACGRVLRGKR
jgi:hypothetical protein